MRLLGSFALFLFLALFSAQAKETGAEPRRLEVLFLGSENISNHDPLTRFRVIRRALGKEGVNFTYSETLDVLTPENLARYDVLLIFANHYTIDKETQGKAMLEFARKGGGCVLLHCAAGCFRNSQFDEYVELLGAQF
jgi:type 1 glutamine amidotransferase